MSVRTVFAGLSVLLLSLSNGCISAAKFSEGTGNEGYPSGTGTGSVCEEVLRQLEVARQMVSQLQGFTWEEFTGIGVVLPPPGVCATGVTYLAEKGAVPSGLGWVPLTEKLCFQATADNFAVACDNCLALARQGCLSGEGASSDGDGGIWYRLESALTGATYLVSTHKNVVAYQIIPETRSQLERSSDAVRGKYGSKFETRCDQYLALLDTLVYHLEKAKQLVSVLNGEQR